MLTICLSPEVYIGEHDAQRLGRSSSEYSADRPSRDKGEAAAACAPSAPRQGPTPNRKICLSDLDLTDVLSSDAVVHRWTRSVQRVQQSTFNVRRNLSVRRALFGAEPSWYSPRPPSFSILRSLPRLLLVRVCERCCSECMCMGQQQRECNCASVYALFACVCTVLGCDGTL